MTQYWVVGGTYSDTQFLKPQPGHNEQRFGPFGSYEEAHKVWSTQAWTTVDDAHARFRIIKCEEDQCSPCATD